MRSAGIAGVFLPAFAGGCQEPAPVAGEPLADLTPAEQAQFAAGTLPAVGQSREASVVARFFRRRQAYGGQDVRPVLRPGWFRLDMADDSGPAPSI